MEMIKTNEPIEKLAAIGGCIASIVSALKILGYQNPHFSGLCNENGHVILATSPDGKTHFSIQVNTWETIKK